MTDNYEQDAEFELALKQRSFMKMDYFGVFVHLHMLPSAERKWQINALLYGRGWFTRLVCRYVLPRLFPEQTGWLRDELRRTNEAIDCEWETEARRQWETIKSRNNITHTYP